jgi:hypothetical protein
MQTRKTKRRFYLGLGFTAILNVLAGESAFGYGNPDDLFGLLTDIFGGNLTPVAVPLRSPARSSSSNNSVNYPQPPARPASLGGGYPQPPTRPAGLGTSDSTAANDAPVPPRRPASFDSPASAQAAPQPAPAAAKHAAVKPALASAPKAAPAPAQAQAAPAKSADCGPGKAKKQEVLTKYDEAITTIEGQLAMVKSQAGNVKSQLDRVIKESACFQSSWGAQMAGVYGKIQAAMGPDSSGATPAQRVAQIPDHTANGFKDKDGTVYVGLNKLLTELQQAKAKYQAMDFCKIDLCNGSLSSLNNLDSNLSASVDAAKKTTAAVMKGIDEANQKISPDKIAELNTAASTFSCSGVASAANAAKSGWDKLKAAYASLKSDMERRSGMMSKQGTALAKLQGTCSAVASNP